MPASPDTVLKILISPLNWGLGHASRLIPIIRAYKSKGYQLILGGSGPSLELLKREFPEIETVYIPSTEIRYKNGKGQFFRLIAILLHLIRSIYQEHKFLKRYISEKAITLVISDNRLGLFNKNVKCIILTHQLWLKMPVRWGLAEILVNLCNHYFIRKFDECWVVDSDKSGELAGVLSRPPLSEVVTRYIGPLSRFAGSKKIKGEDIDILVILGGPEPQRSMLEEMLVGQITACSRQAIIAGGTFIEREGSIPSNIKYYPFVGSSQLESFILNARVIICRSGYSTILDLVALECSAILIPTPGQSEQEYLAEYLSSKRYFLNYKQDEFNLTSAMESWEKFKPKFPAFKFNQFPK